MPDIPPAEPFKSSLPELKLPPGGFQSNLPPHLLEGADEQTRYIMNEISRNTAATQFACLAAVTHNEHLRTLNGKTYKTEKVAEDLRAEILVLKEQAASVSPFLKGMSYFSYLWEYRAFRWTFVLGVLTVVGLLYPYYMNHMFEVLSAAFKHWIGGE